MAKYNDIRWLNTERIEYKQQIIGLITRNQAESKAWNDISQHWIVKTILVKVKGTGVTNATFIQVQFDKSCSNIAKLDKMSSLKRQIEYKYQNDSN